MTNKILLLSLLIILPKFIFCQLGQVLSFDGSDDRVEVDNDTGLSNISELTIEVWVRITEYDVIHVAYRGTSDFITEAYKIGIINGVPEFRIQGGTTTNYILSGNTFFNLNEWYHIAASYDGSEAKLYVNGILDNSDVFNINLTPTPNGQLYIGIDRDGTNNYNQAFQGCMDELRIWNIVKPQSDIQASMNTALTGSESGLVAYYNMEQSSNTLTDISNNQNDGDLQGTGGANIIPMFSDLEVEIFTPLNEFSLCAGETASFDVSGANEYNWGPANLLNNPSIPNPTTSPLSQSTEFWVTGSAQCGANSDTIFIFVEVLESFAQNLTILTCPGTSVSYEGVELNIGDSQTFILETIGGCDSIVNVTISESGFVEVVENISICPGDSILINGNFENSEGTYLILISGSTDCDTLLSIVLDIIDPILIEVSEEPSCSNASTGSTSIIISGGIGPYSLVWDGSPISPSANLITIGSLASGDYLFEVTDNLGCENNATISILSFDEIDIPIITQDVSCWADADGILLIDSTFSALSYSLDSINFSNTTIFQNLDSGDYTLFSQNSNGCISTQGFVINEPAPFLLNLPPDSIIELGCPIQINAFHIGGQAPFSYSWTPDISLSCVDCPDPVALPTTATDYLLTVTDSNQCVVQESIFLGVRTDRKFYIPNAFSPNGDGINDHFCIYPGKSIDKIETFRIYNRWGANVFERTNFNSSDPAFCWDGYLKDGLMGTGVFVFYAEILFLDGVTVTYKGDVSLLK